MANPTWTCPSCGWVNHRCAGRHGACANCRTSRGAPERNVAVIVEPSAGYEAHGEARCRYSHLPNVQTNQDGTAWG